MSNLKLVVLLCIGTGLSAVLYNVITNIIEKRVTCIVLLLVIISTVIIGPSQHECLAGKNSFG